MASTSGAPPSSSMSCDAHMGQQTREHAFPVEHITPRKLIDVEKSVSKSVVVYAADGNASCTASYSALSYVWSRETLSDSDATHVGVKWKVFAFKQENMREVLQIVRNCGVRFLWVDAYCIDQSCEEEKGREVPCMGSYYRNAHSVFILPNGVDNVHEVSITFGEWEWHWCMWTQRVWTVPEVSLAKRTMVLCCLKAEQGQRVRNITTRDLDRQLFPVNIEHHFQLNNNKEIIVIDLQGYCDIVQLKSTGYLDGDREDNSDNDYMDFRFLGATNYSLTGLQDENIPKVNQWIHQIVRRDCKYDVDRVHAILHVLNMNVAFVNTSNDLNGILAKVFEEADIYVLAQLMLATRTSGDGSKMTIYPMVEKIDTEEDVGDMLVHIIEDIHLDNGISKSFDVVDAELVLRGVMVTIPVTVQKYIYVYREGIPSDQEIVGNTPYTLGDIGLPCCVGKCNTNDIGEVELIRLGTVSASDGDEIRMLEVLLAQNKERTEGLVLVCCLACSRHSDGSLEKVGVLLVEEGIFDTIATFMPQTVRFTSRS